MKILPFHFIISLLGIALLASCAPIKWEASVIKKIDLVLPPPPNPERVKYLGELTAFTATGQSLKTIIFGKNDDGRILQPVAIAVAEDGRMAIADSKGQGVHFYVPHEQKYLFLSMAGQERMVSPVSVIFDAEMRVYISDSGQGKVYIYDADGLFVQKISMAGLEPLKRPTGLMYHKQQDLLYVVDTKAHKVHIFDSNVAYQSSFGERGVQDGEFNLPTHIASDFKGNIYVNDAMNFRLQIFSPPDQFLRKFGTHGDGSGNFAMAKGVAVDRGGIIYVAETLFDLIQVFGTHGDYLMSIGSKGSEAGQFWMPSGLFIDKSNILYVCDTYNKRIQLFQLLGDAAGGFE